MAKKRERGNGKGTVYPRKNKQDKIISYLRAYHGPDGKRRYVSAKKKGECQRRLREAMTDADRSLIFDRPDLHSGSTLGLGSRIASRTPSGRGPGSATSRSAEYTSSLLSAGRSSGHSPLTTCVPSTATSSTRVLLRAP